jgi:hypothetical protein
MNDEYADRIADNRLSIDNSRDWLTNDGGVIDRVHRMSAQTVRNLILLVDILFLFSKIPLTICFSAKNKI